MFLVQRVKEILGLPHGLMCVDDHAPDPGVVVAVVPEHLLVTLTDALLLALLLRLEFIDFSMKLVLLHSQKFSYLFVFST